MRGKIDTNDGMVADYEAMLDFVDFLKKMADKLTESRDSAKEAIEKMQDLGNDDETIKGFIESFNKNAELIDQLNTLLDKSSKHYTELADIVKEETNFDFGINANYRNHR